MLGHARIQVWLDQMGEHLRVITEMLTYCGVPQTVADEMVSQVDRDVRGMVCAGPPFDQGLELIARRFDDLLDLVPGLAAGVR